MLSHRDEAGRKGTQLQREALFAGQPERRQRSRLLRAQRDVRRQAEPHVCCFMPIDALWHKAIAAQHRIRGFNVQGHQMTIEMQAAPCVCWDNASCKTAGLMRMHGRPQHPWT